MAIAVTLEEQVSLVEDLELSYRNLQQKAILVDENSGRNIEIPFSSITSKYRDTLSDIEVTIELTTDEVAYYRYRPKLLSYDLYGSTEFWNDILVLNNCYSITEFTPTSKITIYKPAKLKSYLNEIMIIEGLID